MSTTTTEPPAGTATQPTTGTAAPAAAPAGPDLSGLQKAAVLLVMLGKERAANVISHLKGTDLDELTSARAGQHEADAGDRASERTATEQRQGDQLESLGDQTADGACGGP